MASRDRQNAAPAVRVISTAIASAPSPIVT